MINIVFFVAFLWMRCLPPSLSLVVHMFRLSIHVTTGAIGVPVLVQNHANFAFFAVQATALVDVQLLTVARSGSLCGEPSLPRNLHLRRPRRTETTVCRVIYMVLVPVPQASSRARRWSWRHATRRGSCLPSRRSRSRLLKWLW